MGWLFLFGFGIVAMAALALLGLVRTLWSMVGAGLMLGGAGYALQGSPSLPAGPATPMVATAPEDAAAGTLRDEMFGRFTADRAYLVAADALARSGNRHAAAAVLLGGLHRLPKSVVLWTALGGALAAHDGQQLSPTAQFAFQQAERLWPGHPGPSFFLGLADLRAGDAVAADRNWRRALVLSPPNAPYHDEIAARLKLLDRYLASDAAAAPRPDGS